MNGFTEPHVYVAEQFIRLASPTKARGALETRLFSLHPLSPDAIRRCVKKFSVKATFLS